jgi:4-hydroxy-2-oxoheptanedioate aldolase
MIETGNKLRAILTSGRCAKGAAIFSWSPYAVDVAGLSGLDYIRIDTEHAWHRDSRLEQLIRAAIMGDVVPLVRIDKDDPYLARKVLELGAGGLIVPDVRTVEQAEAVVRAAKFPPLGTRGYSSNCWSAGWGSSGGPAWVRSSNDEPMIGIMIEHVDAMANIDEIAAVRGIDFILFGPSDFAMSLGLNGPNAQDERIQKAIVATINAAHSAGVYFSLGVGTQQATIEKYITMGVDMLELSNDLAILKSTWSNTIETVENLT